MLTSIGPVIPKPQGSEKLGLSEIETVCACRPGPANGGRVGGKVASDMLDAKLSNLDIARIPGWPGADILECSGNVAPAEKLPVLPGPRGVDATGVLAANEGNLLSSIATVEAKLSGTGFKTLE